MQNNPTKSNENSTITITRMAPGDQHIALDYINTDSRPTDTYTVILKRMDTDALIECTDICIRDNMVYIGGLLNWIDYSIYIALLDEQGKVCAASRTRLFRTGYVPGTVVNYIHPEDYTYHPSGRSPASPSILRMNDGSLLISHDVFWHGDAQNLTKIFRSDDEGQTWMFLSDVTPCFWGKLFLMNGKLYILGMNGEYGAMLIFHSPDNGYTWTKPSVIMPDGTEETGGPHKGPMPVITHNGRLWTGIDYGAWHVGGFSSGCASISENTDPMVPSNWTIPPFLPYSHDWDGTVEGGNPTLLEGNIVITPDGELVNFLRYNPQGGLPSHGLAIMLSVDKNAPDAPLSFYKTVNFPGSLSKFTITPEPYTGRYYSLVSRVTQNTGQRNILTLISSADLINWVIERDIINYEDNGWRENYEKVGFQYIDFIFDGDDILFLSRTALNDAYNFHNANYITFHRITNFKGEI